MSALRRTRRNNDGPSLSELRFLKHLGDRTLTESFDSMHKLHERMPYAAAHCQKTLDRLESRERWGRRLINRNTVQLTADGRAAYQYACAVLEQHASGPFSRQRETIRVGTSNRVMTAFLAPKLRHFLADRNGADVDLELRELSLDQMLMELRLGQIEIAIGGAPLEPLPRGLTRRSILGALPTVLIAGAGGCGVYDERLLAAGHRVRLAELSAADVCLIRQDWHGALALLPRPEAGYSRIIVDNYASVVSVAQSGAAVGLVLDMGLPAGILKFELEPSERPQPRELSVWTRSGDDLSPTAQRLIRVVLGA